MNNYAKGAPLIYVELSCKGLRQAVNEAFLNDSV